MKFFILLLSVHLGLSTSCGNKNDSQVKRPPALQAEEEHPRRDEAPEENNSLPTDGSNLQGTYLATFSTLNSQINGNVPGSTTLLFKDTRVYVYVRLFAGSPKAWHQQKIYSGSKCPTEKDDTNKDGFIDINEAEAVVGKILIPLDANISSQKSGRNFFPIGDLSGSYSYERITNLNWLIEDLKAEDWDPEDNIIKIGANEPVILKGRPVMVFGVNQDVALPETITSQSKYKPYQTFPVTCGILEEVKDYPGVPDDGVIPGPVADVMEDQDRPAPGVDNEN
jgi:hypothetical protein